MPEKFNNKYRIPSARAQGWDYGSDAAYFITICTKNREHFFGEIVDAKLMPTEIGIIAEKEWLKTALIRPDMNLELGEFIVMPNHFHAIIWIGENKYNSKPCGDKNAKFGPQRKNLSSIGRGYKSAVTAYADNHQIEFGWQARFHDHIIRNEEEYIRIKNYIINNPKKWKEDKFFMK